MSSPIPASSIIESASAIFGHRESKSTHSTSITRQRPNPENDKSAHAMARRLEQLHAIQSAPARATEINQNSVTTSSRESSGIVSLIVTAMISGLLGAGIMWLGTSSGQTPATPPPALTTLAAPIMAAPKHFEGTLIAPAPTEPSDKTRVGELLETWRNAWAQRNITGYMNTYSQQFSPTDGNSHDDWVTARTQKLATGAPIDIRISELGVSARRTRIDF